MLLHAQHGFRGRVVDLDTGRAVPKVIWLDTDRGELEAYDVGPGGGCLRDVNGGYLTYRARGRFRYVPSPDMTLDGVPTPPSPAGPLPQLFAKPHTALHDTLIFPPEKSGGAAGNGSGRQCKVVMGAPWCARCPSVLTLPGDDLCPTCRAGQRAQRHPMKVERILNPLLDRKCERCSRLAQWSVSDEVVVTPSPGVWGIRGRRRKVLYERGMTVGRRYYCGRHYVPPRLLDVKGDVMQVYEDGDGVRPQ